MNEIWKDIEGYEGFYQVSNLGRVRSFDRIVIKPHPKTGEPFEFKHKGRILKPGKDSKGYLFVNLIIDKVSKLERVHRLVARAFVKGWFDGAVVNHKDENRQNNQADNLEWVTFADNLNYGTARQRSTEGHGNSRPVEQVSDDGDILNTYPSIEECARQTGYSPRHVNRCCNDYPKRKTAKGYYLRFKE